MNLKEALEIVINSLTEGPKEEYYNNGICGEIDNLEDSKILDGNTRIELYNFISSNRPSEQLHSEFYNLYPGHFDAAWWWPRMKTSDTSREVRINFLNKLKSQLK